MELIVGLCFCIIVFLPLTVIFVAILRTFSPIGVEQSEKDLEKLSSVYKTTELNIKNLKGVPNAKYKNFKNFSLSSKREIVISDGSNNIIAAVSNSANTNSSVWQLGSAVGYIGKDKFKINSNRLYSEYYINDELIGYSPRVIFFWLFNIMFNNNLQDKNSNKVFEYNRVSLSVSMSFRTKITNLEESVAPQYVPTVINNELSKQEIYSYGTKEVKATINYPIAEDAVSINTNLEFVDQNLSEEHKKILIMFFLSQQLSI